MAWSLKKSKRKHISPTTTCKGQAKMFCRSNTDFWNAYLPKGPFFISICNNSPKRINLNTFRSELPLIYTCKLSVITQTTHIFVLQGKSPNNHAELDCTNPSTQRSWDFFVLSHSDAIGTAKKVEEWLYIQSVDWSDCGNAALVAFQDSCQLLRKSMSAFASEAETDRHEPVRFGLLRCFKQNRPEKVLLEQQARTTLKDKGQEEKKQI